MQIASYTVLRNRAASRKKPDPPPSIPCDANAAHAHSTRSVPAHAHTTVSTPSRCSRRFPGDHHHTHTRTHSRLHVLASFSPCGLAHGISRHRARPKCGTPRRVVRYTAGDADGFPFSAPQVDAFRGALTARILRRASPRHRALRCVLRGQHSDGCNRTQARASLVRGQSHSCVYSHSRVCLSIVCVCDPLRRAAYVRCVRGERPVSVRCVCYCALYVVLVLCEVCVGVCATTAANVPP